MGFFANRRARAAVRAAGNCTQVEVVSEGGDLYLPDDQRQTELDTSNTGIAPWSSLSGVTLRPELQGLLRQVQTAPFQQDPREFTELITQLSARTDLNRAEFLASVSMLTAAIGQRPGEFANPARQALYTLLQNNQHLPAEQLLVASQLYSRLDPNRTENADLRQGIVNILAGYSANGHQNLNFALITTSGDFCTAAEGLRSAFHQVPPSMREHVRTAMARLFEDTQVHSNNSWRGIRVQCAAVVLDPSNSIMITEGEPGTTRLLAALNGCNHDVPPPTPLTAGIVLPLSNGGPDTAVLPLSSGGPGTVVNPLSSGGPTLPPAMTTEERDRQIAAALTNPALARQILANVTQAPTIQVGRQTIALRLAGVPSIAPADAHVHEIGGEQVTQLLRAATNSPLAMTPGDFQGILHNLQNLPALQTHRDAVVEAACAIAEHQIALTSDPVARGQVQQLLAHLEAQLLRGIPADDALRTRIETVTETLAARPLIQ